MKIIEIKIKENKKQLEWTVGLTQLTLHNEGARGGGVDHLWRQGMPPPHRSGEEAVEEVVCLALYPVKGVYVGAASSL